MPYLPYGIFYFMQEPFPYINIHTHLKPNEKKIISVFNAEPGFPNDNKLISLGLHPWYLNKYDRKTIFEKILKDAGKKNVVAIGECGLDKNAEASMEMQEYFFREQIKIAIQFQKPLIIHCVKAFDDLIRIKKECKASVPFIVHGYNNNEQIAGQLLSNGFYLSFGRALLSNDSNAQKVIRITEPSSFFLETDNAEISIMSIFEKAAEIKDLGEEKLKEQMMLNFKTVFNYG